jgi:hypothetical protein
MSTEAASNVASARPRQRLQTTGTICSVHAIRTREPWPGAESRLRVECDLDDGTGTVVLIFLGRAEVPGVRAGRRIRAWGTVLEAGGRLQILNPGYELLPSGGAGGNGPDEAATGAT